MSGKRAKEKQAPPSPLPMRPQRTLLVVLSILLAVWVGVLVTLYFTTVRPQRTATPPPASQAR